MKTILSDSSLKPDEELDYLTDKGDLEQCPLELPSGYISNSQVGTYMRCGMQYYYRYVKGIISPPQARMAEGTAVHRALEVANREKMEAGTVAPLDVLLDAHHDEWEEIRPGIEVWDPDTTEKDILKRAQFFLKRYHQEKLPHLAPKGVEKRFWASVGSDNIPVLGFIDLVATDSTPYMRPGQKKKTVVPTDEVIDFKVVKKTMTQNETDSNMQLTLYSAATKVTTVRFDCFVKTKQPKLATVRSTRKPVDWQWAQNVIEHVARGISAGIFMPTLPTEWSCSEKWCGYWHLCRGAGK